MAGAGRGGPHLLSATRGREEAAPFDHASQYTLSLCPCGWSSKQLFVIVLPGRPDLHLLLLK